MEELLAGDDAREEVRAWAGRFTEAVARKAVPELLDMTTDDVAF